jgi:thermitase
MPVISQLIQPADSLDPADQSFVAGEIIIRYRDSVTDREKIQIRSRHALSRKRDLPLANAERIRIDSGQPVAQAVARLSADSRVLSVQPNYWYYPASDDTCFELEWGLENLVHTSGGSTGIQDVDIDAPDAWLTTMGNSGTIVALIDEGIDLSHPDLAGNIWTNSLEAGGTPGVDDDGNGYVDDLQGWDFIHEDATVYATADAVAALEYARENGADLASNSWGGGSYDQLFKDTITGFGKPFVVAAGNSAKNIDIRKSYPASYDCANIISVTAIDNRGLLASFSNHGAAGVDIGAPGVTIASCAPGSSYAYMSGTSRATPQQRLRQRQPVRSTGHPLSWSAWFPKTTPPVSAGHR